MLIKLLSFHSKSVDVVMVITGCMEKTQGFMCLTSIYDYDYGCICCFYNNVLLEITNVSFSLCLAFCYMTFAPLKFSKKQ